MALDVLATALGLIDQYGLLAIFILLVLDGAMLLPIVPGELIMLLAVAKYATDLPSLGVVIAVATAAALVGGMLLYGVARAGGQTLVKNHPKLFMMSKRRREKLERTFRRPLGQSLVMFLRIFPLLRILVSLPAGLARMPFLRFLVLSTIGLVIFHTGFLYLAYEFRRPDSAVALQATQISDAYGSPAWTYVQANWIVTAAGALLLGVILSVRASRRMARDPEETTGSLIGTLATAILFWGGAGVLVALWKNPDLVYSLALLGGIDVTTIHLGLPYEPFSLVAGAAGLCILLSLILLGARSSAKKHRARLAAEAPPVALPPIVSRPPDEPTPPPRQL